MSNDEQARARLVEIALRAADDSAQRLGFDESLACADTVRRRAGFKNQRNGSWCAAGLTAAMEDAELVVPAPGTPARRGAVALLDFVSKHGQAIAVKLQTGPQHVVSIGDPEPGDIIAWLQNKDPAEWLLGDGQRHAFATMTAPRSMCGRAVRSDCFPYATLGRCSSCVWETRKGHVALIVAVDDESITTVGWNEGSAPGRVMTRRLWRDPERKCPRCFGLGWHPHSVERCCLCKGYRKVPRSSTVLYRKPTGMIYGIARPVAR